MTSDETIYDRVFSQIDEDLPNLIYITIFKLKLKLIDNNSLWENERFMETYQNIHNQLVELIIDITNES